MKLKYKNGMIAMNGKKLKNKDYLKEKLKDLMKIT